MAVEEDGRFSGTGVLSTDQADIVYRSPQGVTYRRSVALSSLGRLELELAFRGSGVHGRVVDPDGRPVSAAVTLRQGASQLRQLPTDSQGAFTIPHVAPGTFLAEARSGSQVGEAPLVRGEEDDDDLEIRVRPQLAASLRVQVVDREGAPAASTLLSVEDGRGGRRVATTNHAGQVEFSGLGPGSVDVLVLYAGRKLTPGPQLVLRAGQVSELRIEEPEWTTVLLQMDESDDPRQLTLKTPAGQATRALLSLAGVELWPDDQGQIVLPDLSEGVWQVGDPKRGYRTISVRGDERTFKMR